MSAGSSLYTPASLEMELEQRKQGKGEPVGVSELDMSHAGTKKIPCFVFFKLVLRSLGNLKECMVAISR